MGHASQRDARNARIPVQVSDVIEIHQAIDGRWYWLRRSRNGRVVTSSQMFRRKWNAKRAGRREARTVNPPLDVLVVG